MTSKPILLEICTGSLEDAVAAQAGGADRIELNSSLLQGGLTPSLGALIEAKQRLSIPVMCMIRPRGGGFCYSEYDLAVMERDAELAVAHGADGIVFGVLTADGEIDMPGNRRILARIGKAQPVFHRAFDVVPDPFRALEQLVDLGVRRVLTTGQEETVYNGAAMIRQLIERAAGRIEILPGGVDTFNLNDVLERTGADQVHAATLQDVRDSSTAARPRVFFGGSLRPPEDSFQVTTSRNVASIKAMMR